MKPHVVTSYGALKRGHTFLFSTGQTFCRKLLYHIVAMIVVKRFGIVTHCCAANVVVKLTTFSTA